MADERRIDDGQMSERVRLRAYELWEAEGRPEGRADDHWSQATREVLEGWHGQGEGMASASGREQVPTPRVGPDRVDPGDAAGTPGAASRDLGRGRESPLTERH